MTDKLELFFFPSCPFCQRVLSVIDHEKISLDLLDIHQDQESMNRLLKDTGRTTVPCLYIDNKPMFESQDIIQWLMENKI